MNEESETEETEQLEPEFPYEVVAFDPVFFAGLILFEVASEYDWMGRDENS